MYYFVAAVATLRVHRQNIQRERPKPKRPRDKMSQDKTSQGQNVPRQNVPGTKCPKKKRPRDKTSYTNYQVFKNKFCVRKLATYVWTWASSVHSIYDWGIPILGRLVWAIPLAWPYWIR